MRKVLGISSAIAMLILFSADTGASVSNGSAGLVLGQMDFTHNILNMAGGLYNPEKIALDSNSGRVYVCDQNNNRVLWWNNYSSLVNGQRPDGVLGQPDLYSAARSSTQMGMEYPTGLAVDNSGNVWVADCENNRVLKFTNPTTSGQAASLVLGQPDFVSKTSTCTQTGMFHPTGLAVDNSGNVWVMDAYNRRVLQFVNPTANGQAANLVLGQSDFVSKVSSCTETGLFNPQDVAVDSSGNVWVADSSNSRVLKFINPTYNGQAASLVLGQNDFISRVSTCTKTGMGYPCNVVVAASGDVWVTDIYNRVLKFANPSSNGQAASLVLGQPVFTSTQSACTQTGFNSPSGVAVDNSGNVWVSDTRNHRILKFTNPASDGQAASLVLGQMQFTYNTLNMGGAGLWGVNKIALDTNSGRVYVCDGSNNRVVWWNNSSSLINGQWPDGALGQPDFYAKEYGCTQSRMIVPSGVAVDNSGNVWVSDYSNNRVLKFAKPISNGEPAILVLGQPDFISNLSTCTKTGMNRPRSVAVDNAGNVWVADGYNLRVLKFVNPLINGQEADLVLGQSDYVSIVNTCTQTGINTPGDIAVAVSGDVWVSDYRNHRVLKFINPTTNGQAASLVLGQPDFTSNVSVCTQSGMNEPEGIALDSSGNVWVADNSYNRVLKFTNPTGNGEAASFVLGQPDYTSSGYACAQTRLYYPHDVAVTDSGDVWVSDSNNHRVLKFYAVDPEVPGTGGEPANIVTAKAYPNPFRPKQGALTVSNLAAEANIEVFNVAGELVRKISYESGSGTASWDGKNDSGSFVASGIYIISIESPQGNKRLKIVLER
ncbi:MAG: hypothetical protein A2219_00535 [Elusimicrobia bacterium RIFOXYA2_FULL_50_26]|nr:MAG: hypothetical protein A2219_00535 [Elusimicrobia bacterium RIFOXYA2_FULL_50_26]